MQSPGALSLPFVGCAAPFAPFALLPKPIIQAYLLLRLVYGERWAAAPGTATALRAYCALVAALALNGTAEARF